VFQVSGQSVWALLKPVLCTISARVAELEGAAAMTTTAFPDRVRIVHGAMIVRAIQQRSRKMLVTKNTGSRASLELMRKHGHGMRCHHADGGPE
jgi:hypothetical protein